MILRRLFPRSTSDEAANIRESIARDNKRGLGYRLQSDGVEVKGAPWSRPAGLGDFERNLLRRHVLQQEPGA